MRRYRVSYLIIVCAIAAFSGAQSVATAEAQLKFTGCLKSNGKVVRVAPGDQPSKACKPDQTEIMLSGTDKTDALMEKDVVLMEDVSSLQTKDAELMSDIDSLKVKDVVLMSDISSLQAKDTELMNKTIELMGEITRLQSKDIELMNKDMDLMGEVSSLRTKDMELMEQVNDLQMQIAELTKCGTGQLLNGGGECVSDPNACAVGEVLLGGGEGCFPANQLAGYPCGNGQIDDGEQCDDGFSNNGPDALCDDSCEWNCPCDFFTIPFAAWSGTQIDFLVEGGTGTSCSLESTPSQQNPILSVSEIPNGFSCASGNDGIVSVNPNLTQMDALGCALSIELYSTLLNETSLTVSGANSDGEYICPVAK